MCNQKKMRRRSGEGSEGRCGQGESGEGGRPKEGVGLEGAAERGCGTLRRQVRLANISGMQSRAVARLGHEMFKFCQRFMQIRTEIGLSLGTWFGEISSC